MKWLGFETLLIVAAVALPLDAAQRQTAHPDFGAGYDALGPQQKELFDELIQGYSEIVGEEVEPRVAFQSIPVSVRTTYHAITHALLTTVLTDADGTSLGTALDRVASLETIRGRVKGARGDLQFRVYCLLEPGTLEVLEKSQEVRRTHDNTVYH